MKTVVFTVCTAEQYPFAKVLADSLPQSVIFRIGVTEGNVAGATTLAQLGRSEWDSMQKRYDASALVAASKPYFAEYFLKEEKADAVIYFDPTVWVLGDLSEMVAQLQKSDIVLTPRLTRKFEQSPYGDEKFFLNTGMYDAGFWAIRVTDNSLRFLRWWQARLTDRAFFDVCNGMNHDQLWLNYVPIYFNNVKLPKNVGWNVALHNLHERILTWTKEGWKVNQDTPLVFFNFRECLTSNLTEPYAGASALKKHYVTLLKAQGSTPPAPFSVRDHLYPSIAGWKQSLKKSIQSAIDFVQHFPLYHKINQ